MSQNIQLLLNDFLMETNQDNLYGTTLISFECENVNVEDSIPEIVLSNRGGPKLIYDNYIYTLHKKHSEHIRWRCVGRITNCKGILLTTTDYTKPEVCVPHNHEPSVAAVQLARERYLEIDKTYALKKVQSEGKKNIHQSFVEMERWRKLNAKKKN